MINLEDKVLIYGYGYRDKIFKVKRVTHCCPPSCNRKDNRKDMCMNFICDVSKGEGYAQVTIINICSLYLTKI